ncbi:MAG: GNAT family N-acetyltransferase [Bacteroidota bacterium]
MINSEIALTIRQLTELDFPVWKKIRMEALTLHPDAFWGDSETEQQKSDLAWQEDINKSAIFGVFYNKELIGTAGFYKYHQKKRSHIGSLFGVYVKKEFRAQGIADKLLKVVIKHASNYVFILHCCVTTHNRSAFNLYERHGFKEYGIEHKAIKVNDTYYDEILMSLTL